MIQITLEFHGEWNIGFAVENGKDRTREYFNELIRLGKNEALDKIRREFQRFSHNGPLRNIQKFRHEGDGIYAIKEDRERIYGFFCGKHFFACAAGTSKKSQKPDQGIRTIAKRIKKEFEATRPNRGS